MVMTRQHTGAWYPPSNADFEAVGFDRRDQRAVAPDRRLWVKLPQPCADPYHSIPRMKCVSGTPGPARAFAPVRFPAWRLEWIPAPPFGVRRSGGGK
jgi:hypothetical protein